MYAYNYQTNHQPEGVPFTLPAVNPDNYVGYQFTQPDGTSLSIVACEGVHGLLQIPGEHPLLLARIKGEVIAEFTANARPLTTSRMTYPTMRTFILQHHIGVRLENGDTLIAPNGRTYTAVEAIQQFENPLEISLPFMNQWGDIVTKSLLGLQILED